MKLTLCLTFILFFALFSLPASPVMAQEGVLRVAFNELPPWKIMDEDGQPTGIDIEFLRMVAQKAHLQLKFIPYPFKRGLKMLEVGEIDIMVGVLKRPEREEYLHFIEPPYKTSSNKAFYVLKGHEHTITKYADLHHLRVGTGLGAKFFPRFDADENIQKYPVTSADLNIRMLLEGRIDTFVMTESSGDYRIAKLGLNDTIGKADFGHREPQKVYMVLSKRSKHAKRLSEFSRITAELMAAGTMDSIKSRFYSNLTPE